jgi:hypothetical protein
MSICYTAVDHRKKLCLVGTVPIRNPFPAETHVEIGV